MLKQKILNGEKIIGTHINFSDPSVGRIAGLAGFDYIWIDTEHNYISFESLLSQIITVRSTGTDVIVRVPQDDLTATKKVLEMGPDGIVFPMVRSAEEARAAIEAGFGSIIFESFLPDEGRSNDKNLPQYVN